MIVGATSGIVDVWGPIAQQFAHLDKITRELQDMATSLRMVPLNATVRKMARLVRDLARDAGKQVEFVASGEDTELDRALVDVVADALVHLIRNAVDHGIESPDEREAAGKPKAGRISLEAYHQGGAVHIRLSDDGRGIDPARVLEKARALGLVPDDAQLTERETIALIMEPAFTTAERVTAVSGRGVGMDAVRRTVEDLHGQVDISSTPGEGTRFHLRVPLTLAVIDGMVVRVGDERYIVPTASIVRSVRPEPEQLTSVLGGGTVMTTENGLVPLVSLAGLFGVEDAKTDPTDGIVTVVSDGERSAGIAACELLGQQQVVIKPLGEAFRGMPGLAGGAIMPDGTVGLIADVAGLIELVSTERG
jgi:two-component system chemotaxis sensor kinase CheA